MRRLRLEELKVLESKFITYLISKGIDAQEWLKIQEYDVQRTDSIIDEFSKIFFSSYLPRIEYLTYTEGHVKHVVLFRTNGTSEFILNSISNHIGYKESGYPLNADTLKFELLEKGYQITERDDYLNMATIYANSK